MNILDDQFIIKKVEGIMSLADCQLIFYDLRRNSDIFPLKYVSRCYFLISFILTYRKEILIWPIILKDSYRIKVFIFHYPLSYSFYVYNTLLHYADKMGGGGVRNCDLELFCFFILYDCVFVIFFTWPKLERGTYYFYSHLIAYKSVTWEHVISKNAEKCSLSSNLRWKRK